MNTNTLAADTGVAAKKLVNAEVEPSPVADNLDIAGVVPSVVTKLTHVDPSSDPSYNPVCVLNLITP